MKLVTNRPNVDTNMKHGRKARALDRKTPLCIRTSKVITRSQPLESGTARVVHGAVGVMHHGSRCVRGTPKSTTAGVVPRMSNAVFDVVRLRMSRRTHLAAGIVLGRASDTAAGTVADHRCRSGR